MGCAIWSGLGNVVVMGKSSMSIMVGPTLMIVLAVRGCPNTPQILIHLAVVTGTSGARSLAQTLPVCTHTGLKLAWYTKNPKQNAMSILKHYQIQHLVGDIAY